MDSFLIYLLKSSGVMLLFFLCYQILLKKETFFNLNRWFLLLGLFTSLCLPLLTYTKIIWIEGITYNLTLPQTLTNLNVLPLEQSFDWTIIVLLVYSIGVIVCVLKFLFQIISLKRLINRSKVTKEGANYMVETNRELSPFSFFKYIVFNPKMHEPAELNTILTHEKSHTKAIHSLDIVGIELIAAFFWFNPVIWWYKLAIQQNLEFIADAQVIKQTRHKKEYQYLLLNKSLGHHKFSIVNPFFNSLIKKRILMLNQNQSQKRYLLKYGTIIPFLIGFLIIFNTKTIAQTKPLVQENKSEENILVTKKMAQTQIRIKSDTEAIYPLIIIDGKESKKEDLNKLDKQIIASMNILKGEKAIYKYGNKAKGGAIQITTKKYSTNKGLTPTPSKLIVHDSITRKVKIKGQASGIKIKTKGEEPLLIIDGKETPYDNLVYLNPEEIATMNVWKGKKAKQKYGNKAKNGVFDITTKKNAKYKAITYDMEKSGDFPNKLSIFQNNFYSPNLEASLYIIDGKEVSKTYFENLDADTIKHINVLKGEKAIKKYGNKAKDGAVEVQMKNVKYKAATYDKEKSGDFLRINPPHIKELKSQD